MVPTTENRFGREADDRRASVEIDCDVCVARGPGCQDCMVTVLLGPPPEQGFPADQVRALSVLADSGLVPPLRMMRAVRPVAGPEVESA